MRRTISILAALSLVAMPRPAEAWNNFGHRVIASIAFRELNPVARAKIVAMFDRHPAARDPHFWAEHPFNSSDRGLDHFMNASLFADDVRGEGPFHLYHISRAHYVNWRLRADQGGLLEDPARDLGDDDPHGDVLESLTTNVAIVKNPEAAPADRAVALSWLFHQLGDLHQPLHTVARYTLIHPGGDRGGNEVRVPGGNLHGYWDNVLGRDEDPGTVAAMVDQLMTEHPRPGFQDELDKPALAFREFALEGVELARGVAYRNLDPAIGEFSEFPVGYQADAAKTARRRVALAGYRLAALLEELAASLPGPTHP